MKRILLLGALLGSTLYAQDIAGDWKGTITTPTLELRVALHIKKGANGGLTATMDSVDQGANGVAIGSIALTGQTLKFTVEAAHGQYTGKLAGNVVDGVWTQQGMPFPLKFERGTFKPVLHKPGKPSDIDGAWQGNLSTPQGVERLTFHFLNTADGLTATLQDGARVIQVTSVIRKGTKLRLEIKAIGGVFEGDIAPDHFHHILGNFTQNGATVPMILQR